ncbi:hypothetical protein D187_000076 [Cystobacter fuscus DSM 2262]|uniref:Uncharacterized protein n=1 Tax=Cystobacter fuscus (strain ATCC 25194 / DSM 2262 / NBRC 100088 / M29) TaxID=1242864 RepID=S9QTP5_CYSF2|nr:hypothetical protein D187_000076 [Cystobacter fuscus DSM 2262]
MRRATGARTRRAALVACWTASLPRGTPGLRRPGMSLPDAGRWQVFGLASVGVMPPTPSPSQLRGASGVDGFVLADRCGAAPDSHRIPF